MGSRLIDRACCDAFAAARAAGTIIAALLLFSACTDGYVEFPTTESGQKALGDDVEVIVLTPENISSFSHNGKTHIPTRLPSQSGWTYAVGPGDILSVIVFDHPELTLPAGPQRSAAETGFLVASDGTITYPYIGSLQVGGRSLGQIRSTIAERLASVIPDPQVDVRVAEYNSQSVVVSGEVKTPNRQSLQSVPLSLIEAVNAAGGATDIGDLRNVTVQRRGKTYQVDLAGFLKGGIAQNNPILRDGDIVNVPRRRAEEAYLLGEISKPDVIDLSQDSITLTQAVARRGGLELRRATSRGVLVFRAQGHKTLVFQLDTSTPTGLLLGTKFVLQPDDVVYVLRSGATRWNDTIIRLLPTVRAVREIDSLAN